MSAAPRVEDVARSLLAAWNDRDLDRFVALLAPDVSWHDLGMPSPPAVGREAVRQFSESILRAFPDFQYVIRAPICTAADNSACLIPWTVTATNSGPLDPPGFAATNRRVQMSGLDYLTFRDGLVASVETRFDPAEPIAQIFGIQLRPRPGSVKERIAVNLQRLLAAWLRRGRAATS